MAINPNTDFSSGAVLTAAQQNRFPRGVMALATSSTSYTVTTSAAIATGMTATFTAVANRNYKITYFEPQVLTPSVVNGFVSATIRLTNAAGAAYVVTYNQTNTAAPTTQINNTSVITTFSAGSVTLVGCLVANSTTGTPIATRAATALAYILVEDIGPA
jgi:hypothetical protein